MTEYEAATLAFRNASLAAQHAGLWIAAAHVAVGLIQAGIVWYGIRAMQRAADRRADESRRLEVADERRHAEAMRALDHQHAESMQALSTLIDGQREQGAALAALIARTAPAGTESPSPSMHRAGGSGLTA